MVFGFLITICHDWLTILWLLAMIMRKKVSTYFCLFHVTTFYLQGSGISSGIILQRFPEKDWEDTPFIEGIEWVCTDWEVKWNWKLMNFVFSFANLKDGRSLQKDRNRDFLFPFLQISTQIDIIVPVYVLTRPYLLLQVNLLMRWNLSMYFLRKCTNWYTF